MGGAGGGGGGRRHGGRRGAAAGRRRGDKHLLAAVAVAKRTANVVADAEWHDDAVVAGSIRLEGHRGRAATVAAVTYYQHIMQSVCVHKICTHTHIIM